MTENHFVNLSAFVLASFPSSFAFVDTILALSLALSAIDPAADSIPARPSCVLACKLLSRPPMLVVCQYCSNPNLLACYSLPVIDVSITLGTLGAEVDDVAAEQEVILGSDCHGISHEHRTVANKR